MAKAKLRKGDLEEALQYVKTLAKLKPGMKYGLKEIAGIIQRKDPNFRFESVKTIETTLKEVNDELGLLDKGEPIGVDEKGVAIGYWYLRSLSPEEMAKKIEEYNNRYYTPLTGKRYLQPKEVKSRSLFDFE